MYLMKDIEENQLEDQSKNITLWRTTDQRQQMKIQINKYTYMN